MNRTTETYNRAAEAYAEKFSHIGRRVADIDRGIDLWGGEGEPCVVELGCGNGRDAQVIFERTKRFTGVDASKVMIRLAREWVPRALFLVEDMRTYEIPDGTDIVYAFASFLHLNREEVQQLLTRIHGSLTDGGVVYLSVKRDDYHEYVRVDDYGPRTFYFYQESDFRLMAEGLYKMVYTDEQTLLGVEWLTVVLKK